MRSQRMTELLRKGKKLIVGYVVAAYPGRDSFFGVLREASRGLDILEIGFPSADPYCDGQIIQEVHALADHDAARDPEYWQRIRRSVDAPIWVMAYRKDFVDTGMYRRLAEKGLLDAVVLPDTDEKRLDEISEELEPFGTDVVRFLRPGMTDEEMDRHLKNAAIVYEQLYAGRTGECGHKSNYRRMLDYSRLHSGAASFAGFGISTQEKVREVFSAGFDGAVIGTELQRRLNISLREFGDFIENLHQAVESE